MRLREDATLRQDIREKCPMRRFFPNVFFAPLTGQACGDAGTGWDSVPVMGGMTGSLSRQVLRVRFAVRGGARVSPGTNSDSILTVEYNRTVPWITRLSS